MTLENQTIRFKPKAEDNETGAVTLLIAQAPGRGVVRVVGDELEYVPEPDQVYQTQFTYKASDGALESQPAIVTVQVVDTNKAPEAQAQQLTTAEDTRLAITLTGSDPDGDLLRAYDIVRAPRRGTLLGAGAMRTYVPGPELSGEDSFSFKVSDGVLESAEAEVRIRVTAVDDPPVFIEPLHDGVTRSQDGAPIDLTFAAMDVDSAALTWTATGLPAGATFEQSRLRWTPTDAQQGAHQIEIAVSDGVNTVKRTKSLLVVFLDANVNGVPDVRERALVAELSQRADEDGDGIRNFEEIGDLMAPHDTDRDGTLDVFDLDSDGDGVPDQVEAGDSELLTPPVDSDGDGVPDFQQVDSDGDGIEDGRDNCRRAANPDQADRDDNGLGDACDDAGELPFAPSERADEGGCAQGAQASPANLWWIVLSCGIMLRRRVKLSSGVTHRPQRTLN